MVTIVFSFIFYKYGDADPRYDDTIGYFKDISTSDIAGIEVVVSGYSVTNKNLENKINGKMLKQLLDSLRVLTKYDWSASNDISRRVDIYLQPSNIAIRAHLRALQPEYIFGYLGEGGELAFTNYGEFRSKELRVWFDKNYGILRKQKNVTYKWSE